MAREFWIADIRCSDAIEEKLNTKHNLTCEKVRSVCVPKQYDQAGWHNHPQYGWRLLVETHDEQGPIRVILWPIDPDDGIWRLGSAWRRIK